MWSYSQSPIKLTIGVTFENLNLNQITVLTTHREICHTDCYKN